MDALERHRLATAVARLVEAELDISEPAVTTKCPCCGRESGDVRNRRRNTAYCESLDSHNWIICCGECFKADTEHFADMWADYYSGCM